MANRTVANKVKLLREQRAWSQSHLAEAAGLSTRTIQRLEKKGECSKETLLSIAAAFDIDIEKFTSLMPKDWPTPIDEKYLLNIGHENGAIFFSIRNWFSRKSKQAQKLMAAAGIVLLLTPVSYVVLNILKYSLGFEWIPNPFDSFTEDPDRLRVFNFISPIVFLGSIGSAFILNLFPFLDFDLNRKPAGWFSFFRYEGTQWNWSVIGVSLLTLLIMISYFISENIGEHAIQSLLK